MSATDMRAKLFWAFSLLLGTSLLHAADGPWPRRPGVVLYRLKPGASVSVQYSAGSMRRIGAGSLRAITVAPGGKSEEAIAEELRASGAVLFAEPDYAMEPTAIPNDTSYATQWHHAKIGSPAAWDVTTGNNSVVVAICDTGVDSSHLDLAANMQLPGYNVVDGTTDTTPIANHGTAVAGVLGAVGNNGMGVTGMAWNIKILPVRITNNSNTLAFCSDMATGIEWAADHGAKVINLSYNTVGCPNTIDAAAAYANGLGATVFVSAGNQTQNLTGGYPSNHSFILVGASDPSDQLANFSNYGSPLDLVAPGSGIYTTSPGNSYASWNGTSFASPLAAGVAALLYSISPSFTPAQIRNFLLATALDLGPSGKDNSFGFGRLDAAAATASAIGVLNGNPPPTVSGLPAPTLNLPSHLSVHGSLSAHFPAGYTIARYEWELIPSAPPAGASGQAAGRIPFRGASWTTPAGAASLTEQALEPGYYLVSVKAYDASGVVSPAGHAYITLVQGDFSNARVFPNPWRSDQHGSVPVTFDNLTANATVKIFTIAGHLVRTLSTTSDTVLWDRTNDSGETVASGLYLYLITNDQGQKRTGKLALIR